MFLEIPLGIIIPLPGTEHIFPVLNSSPNHGTARGVYKGNKRKVVFLHI